MSNPRDIEICREFKRRLETKFPIYECRLFGSRARGDAHPDSDYDLLVVVEKRDPAVRRVVTEIAAQLGEEYDILITPLLRSKKVYDVARIGPLYRNIEEEGIPL